MFLRYLVLSLLIVLLIPAQINAQDVDKSRSEVPILNFDTSFTARVYFSQKYLNTTISNGSLPKLTYTPNSKLALGVGASYGWFTLNLSAALGFLQPTDDPQGKTKAYDLQGHFYGPKATVDLFAGYYDGQYLSPEGRGNYEGKYYVRPDVESWQLGFAGYYALNWRRFSYRSSYLQTAWQQKSAGTALLGFELYNGQIKGDSALIPAIYALAGDKFQMNRYRYFNWGPGVGYAYTLVIAKHWFASAAATVNISANWVRETSLGTFRANTFSLRPNTSYKAGLGYNASKFSIDLTWVHNTVYNKGELAHYRTGAGNVRLHFAWHFKAGKKFRQFFDFLQKPLL